MATAYKCDWCEKLMLNRYNGDIVPAKRVGIYTLSLDICPECGQKFENFLKEVTLDEDEEVSHG